MYKALLYSAARLWPWLEGARRGEAWAEVVAALSDLPQPLRDTLTAPPAALAEWPRWVGKRVGAQGLSWRGLLPEWLWAQAPSAVAEQAAGAEAAWALLTRKPLWVRRQRVGWDALASALDAAQLRWRRLQPADPSAPDAAEVDGDPDLTRTQPWREGWLEVQDLGSQRLLGLAPLASHGGLAWLDACAGAGGKALQLAAILGPAARVFAEDVRADALAALRERAARAGVASQLRTRQVREVSGLGEGRGRGLTPRDLDGVLIDAPCSGTGTWGRHPHMRAATTPAHLARAADRQRALLAAHAPRVRPGGLVLYATCSVCQAENGDVVRAFLDAHPGFDVIPLQGGPCDIAGPFGLTLWPNRHDGFFLCALRRTASAS